MSDRNTLKTFFETGDVPTEAQFADLIDSKFNLIEDNFDDIADGSVYKKIATGGAAPTNGQVLAYNSANSQYEPTTVAGGGTGTNLTSSASATGVTVESDTGTDAVLPLADGTNAGLLSPADKTKVDNLPADQSAVDAAQDTAITAAQSDATSAKTKTDFISVTQAVDLDALEADVAGSKAKTDLITITQAVDLDGLEQDVADHQSALGIVDGDTDLGVFSGSIIADNETVKGSIQDLEDNSSLNRVDTVDPTSTNDSSEGFSINSTWTNTGTGNVFKLVDDTAGSAVWRNITEAGGSQDVTGFNPGTSLGYTTNFPFFTDGASGIANGRLWVEGGQGQARYESASFPAATTSSGSRIGKSIDAANNIAGSVLMNMGTGSASFSSMGFSFSGTSTSPTFALSGVLNTQNTPGLTIGTSGGSTNLFAYASDGSDRTRIVIGTLDGQFHKYGIAFDGTEARYYIDDVLAGTITTDLPSNIFGIGIGGSGQGAPASSAHNLLISRTIN